MVIHWLEEAQLRICAAGPGVQLLTKYGLFALRYYEEFGANATASARQLMFSVTLRRQSFWVEMTMQSQAVEGPRTIKPRLL